MTIWIVYNTASREIVVVTDNAAEAALWAISTELTATGALNTLATIDAQPGQYYLADGTVSDTAPRTDIQSMRLDARRLHEYLNQLWAKLHQQGAAHTWAEVVKVHDYIAAVHHATYQTIKVNPLANTALSRSEWCVAMLAGPFAVGGLVQLSIPLAFQEIASNAAVGTVQAVAWVTPVDNAHYSIADSLNTLNRLAGGLGSDMAPLVITESELASGAWIETVTA